MRWQPPVPSGGRSAGRDGRSVRSTATRPGGTVRVRGGAGAVPSRAGASPVAAARVSWAVRGAGGAGASGPRRWGRARTEPPGRSPRRSRGRRGGGGGRHGRGGRSVRARSGRTGAAPVPGARTHPVRRRAALPAGAVGAHSAVEIAPRDGRRAAMAPGAPRGRTARTRRPAPSAVARRTLRRSDTPWVPVPWPDRRAAVIRPTPSVRCPPGGPEGQKALGAGYGGRHHECFAEFR